MPATASGSPLMAWRKLSLPPSMATAEKSLSTGNLQRRVYAMFFTVSKAIAERTPANRDAVIAIDRALAAAYHASGHGWTDMTTLETRTGLSPKQIGPLITFYKRA